MNIKLKLTLRFTIITISLLLTIFVVIYEYYALFRKNSFQSRLEEKAIYLAKIILESEGIDSEIVEKINKYSINNSPNQQISIYNQQFKLVHVVGESIPISSANIPTQLNYTIESEIQDTQFVYAKIKSKNDVFIIASSGYDSVGFSKLVALRKIIILLFTISVIIVLISGWIFASLALKPIKKIIVDVDNITANNLHSRLTINQTKDEINALTKTFNNMLDRLESSFQVQKSFVSNASHEFRTPLTAMKGQIQVAMFKARTQSDYEKILQSLNDDINNIISLLNALHELAKANNNLPYQTFQTVPIIETIIDARNELLRNKPEFQITLNLKEIPESLDTITCKGDAPLLKSCITNLLDNGCKFSRDNACQIAVEFSKQFIIIEVKDNGFGINEKDIPYLFEPFYRSNDTRNIPGHGIGLSLVKKIIEQHKGRISFHTELAKGSVFTISLPNSGYFEMAINEA